MKKLIGKVEKKTEKYSHDFDGGWTGNLSIKGWVDSNIAGVRVFYNKR